MHKTTKTPLHSTSKLPSLSSSTVSNSARDLDPFHTTWTSLTSNASSIQPISKRNRSKWTNTTTTTTTTTTATAGLGCILPPASSSLGSLLPNKFTKLSTLPPLQTESKLLLSSSFSSKQKSKAVLKTKKEETRSR
ncbi:hypothetical protein HMI56_005426 [Coelomomyces lativittatus]|nr:hypothetical protein HMI56_005426 [Coelomomyces lativittatus]